MSADASERSEPQRKRFGSSTPPRLTAVLEMFERPAAVVALDGRVILSNRPFDSLANRTPRDADAQFDSLIAPRSRPVWNAVLDRVARGDGRANEAAELDWIDGRRSTVRLTRIGRDNAPAALAVVGCMGAAAVALRHELAGPLTSLLGTVEMMLAHEERLPEDVAAGLRRVLVEGGRMTALLMSAQRSDGDERP